MKCDHLISLIKNWYLRVQEEAMAPARMVTFMEKHISQCEECLADPDLSQEVDKIKEIVLPPSKTPKPKVARVPKEDVDEDETTKDETTEDENEDVETGEDGDEVEEDDGDDDDDDDDDKFDPDIMDEDDEV